MPVSNVPNPLGDDAVDNLLGEVVSDWYADNQPRDTRHPDRPLSQMEMTRTDE